MTTCPNCGKAITPNDKFCSNCGTPLAGRAEEASVETTMVEDTFSEEVDRTTGETVVTDERDVRTSVDEPARGTTFTESTSSSTPPPPRGGYPMPPPVDFVPSSRPSVEEEWRMSSLGPPPKRRRSIWLYILIGILALCLLSCVGFIGFSLTDTGREWIENMATEAALQATEAAD